MPRSRIERRCSAAKRSIPTWMQPASSDLPSSRVAARRRSLGSIGSSSARTSGSRLSSSHASVVPPRGSPVSIRSTDLRHALCHQDLHITRPAAGVSVASVLPESLHLDRSPPAGDDGWGLHNRSSSRASSRPRWRSISRCARIRCDRSRASRVLHAPQLERRGAARRRRRDRRPGATRSRARARAAPEQGRAAVLLAWATGPRQPARDADAGTRPRVLAVSSFLLQRAERPWLRSRADPARPGPLDLPPREAQPASVGRSSR